MPIHDHFDGSAHCVECEGPCKLTGDSLALTEIVRWILQSRVRERGAWLNLLEAGTIESAGADPAALIRRAQETHDA